MIIIPKSKFLIILGIIVIVTVIGSKAVQVIEWSDNDWNVTGVSPGYGPIIIIWAVAYMLVLFFHKITAPSLWIMGVTGLGFGILATWMVSII